MTKLKVLGLLFTLACASVFAQLVDVTAVDGGRFTCRVDGVAVPTQHIAEYTAAERVANLTLLHPEAKSVLCERHQMFVGKLTPAGRALVVDPDPSPEPDPAPLSSGEFALYDDFNWPELTDLSRGAPTPAALGVPVQGYVGVINPGRQPRPDVFTPLPATVTEGGSYTSRDMGTVLKAHGHSEVGESTGNYAYPNGVLAGAGRNGSPAYVATFEGGKSTASSQYWREYIRQDYRDQGGLTEFWALIRIYWSENYVWDNITQKTGYFLADDTYDFRVPLFMAPDRDSVTTASGAFLAGRLEPDLYSSTGWFNPRYPARTTAANRYLGANVNDFNIDDSRKGKWIDIKLHVKQNTRGYDGSLTNYFGGGPPDGVFQVWWKEADQPESAYIKSHDHHDVQWSPKDKIGVGITNYWHSYYWGGSGTELTEDMYLKIDRLVIAPAEFETPE